MYIQNHPIKKWIAARRVLILTSLLAILFGACFLKPSATAFPAKAQQGSTFVYLPIVRTNKSNSIVIGMYPTGYWQPLPINALQNEFYPVENWSGKRISIAAIFHQIQGSNPPVLSLLTPLWDAGYTPFVNLYVNASARTVADGGMDGDIIAWARQFVQYANGGQRMAFLAPMQEMNYPAVPYALDPANYKKAYERIQTIFAGQGVPRESVRWVFAPNGYTRPGDPPVETYYPGDSKTDIISISAYNFGYHPKNAYKDWETPPEVFLGSLDHIRSFAPNKPLIISQTGTTAYYSNGINWEQKNKWLKDAYNLLASYPNMVAVIYYSANQDFDWSLFTGSQAIFSGYTQGIANGAYTYMSPNEIKASALFGR
jgi:hypothetical protein